jgi:excisionase family DNA binding protein
MNAIIPSPTKSAPSFGRFLTLNEAAEMLTVSKRTIMREIARGRFPKPAKIGRSTRVSLADVETYAASLRS